MRKMLNTQIYDEIINYLNKNAAKFGIIYAIIFGSAISNYFREDSDIDIAIRFSEHVSLERIAEINCGISKITHRNVDLIDISNAPPGLKYEIFVNGQLLYCKSRKIYVEDKALAYSEYLDFKWVSDFHFRRVMNALRRIAL